jgi:hypothetical protein
MTPSTFPDLRLGDPRLRDQPTVRPGDVALRAAIRTLAPTSLGPKHAVRRVRLLLVTQDEDMWLVVRALACSADGVDAQIEWVDRQSDAEVALSRRRFDGCVLDPRAVAASWIEARPASPPVAILEPAPLSPEAVRRALVASGCSFLR